MASASRTGDVEATGLGLLFGVLFDVVDRVLDGADLLRVLVGNVDLEGFLECEDELDETKRVGAEVLDERRLRLDVLLFDVELLLDDALDLAGDVLGHFLHASSISTSFQHPDAS